MKNNHKKNKDTYLWLKRNYSKVLWKKIIYT
jgi:hypothetical protein